MNGNTAGAESYNIQRINGKTHFEITSDLLSIEEPLEIRLSVLGAGGFPDENLIQTISLTMRTPGHDSELAAGFLLTEGVISKLSQIERIDRIGIDWLPDESGNAIQVTLGAGHAVDLGRLQRNFYTSSSCGICGKTSIDAVRTVARGMVPSDDAFVVERNIITALPDRLRSEQAVFDRTGGLHASALFTSIGELLCLREDVGRHNALDKLIGAELLARRLPLENRILLVSGRASFELVQKAVMAGLPMLAAVGAPSSLAVDLAREFGMTLIGFLRGERFNIYSAPERVA